MDTKITITSEEDSRYSGLTTEERNIHYLSIDLLPIEEILKIINDEDKKVFSVIREQIPNIKKASQLIIEAFEKDGRLFYVGSGTSGRLGILDAAECPPTFGVSPKLVQGIIAGGKEAMFKAVEIIEDKKNIAIMDLKDVRLNQNDVVVGITASGETPYTMAALEYAKGIGCKTIAIISSTAFNRIEVCDVVISLIVGAEVITGSTRMKAGTAQKMVLNMLSTVAMIKSGRTFGNLMVDLSISNTKLKDRAIRILMDILDIKRAQASELLEKSNNQIKVAILMHKLKIDKQNAIELLDKHHGKLRECLN